MEEIIEETVESIFKDSKELGGAIRLVGSGSDKSALPMATFHLFHINVHHYICEILNLHIRSNVLVSPRCISVIHEWMECDNTVM